MTQHGNCIIRLIFMKLLLQNWQGGDINGQLKVEESLAKTNPQRDTPFPLSGPMLLLFQCVFSLTEFVFGKENMLNKIVNQRTNKQHR